MKLRAWMEGEGFDPSGYDFGLIEGFISDLYDQNQLYNLTAVPLAECEGRHIIDSCLLQGLIDAGSSVLDIGTGAGFPAWPLAWLRPDLSLTAMDSTAKKLRFILRHPLPNLRVFEARAEDGMVSVAYDLVTGRAVAPLGVQAEISAHHVREGGRFVPFRVLSEAELFGSFPELGLELEMVVSSGQDEGRAFPIYSKTGPNQSGYPRKWAEIKGKPLVGRLG